MSDRLLEISMEDGKYSVFQESDGRLHALRHGEPWARDIVGDKLVLALAQEVARLRGVCQEVNSWIVCACIAIPADMMQSAARIEEITRCEENAK